MGYRKYPIEIRNEMVDKYLFGEAVSYIAENMHIPYHTTRNIIYAELAQRKIKPRKSRIHEVTTLSKDRDKLNVSIKAAKKARCIIDELKPGETISVINTHCRNSVVTGVIQQKTDYVIYIMADRILSIPRYDIITGKSVIRKAV